MATQFGGHLGFLGRRPARLWADAAIMQWIVGTSANENSSQSSED